MRKIFGIIGLGALLVTGLAAPASASVYVWKDEVNDFTFSFPDSWTIQTDDRPTTRVRIAGPLAEDFATCRVMADKDGRTKIYPKHLMTNAVDETLTRDFWEQQVAEHEKAVVTEYRAPVSMGGKGDATAIKTSFVQDGGNGKVDMYGSMVGSIYGDTRYIVSCSSKAGEFKKYAPLFATIMASVNLESKYHPFASGYYRDFLSDPKLMLPRSKPGTVFEKNRFVLRPGQF